MILYDLHITWSEEGVFKYSHLFYPSRREALGVANGFIRDGFDTIGDFEVVHITFGYVDLPDLPPKKMALHCLNLSGELAQEYSSDRLGGDDISHWSRGEGWT